MRCQIIEACFVADNNVEALYQGAFRFIATTGDLRHYSDGGVYLNFPGFQEEGEALMRAQFGRNYARLAALKQQYDPTNLFRLNQNIAPG